MRPVVAVIPFVIACAASAQCGMITNLSAGTACWQGNASVNVVTVGGVGPYTIWVERVTTFGWTTVAYITNDADGAYQASFQGDSWWQQSFACRVTVTDVNGGVATDVAGYPSIDPLPYSGCAAHPDCQTGLSNLEITTIGGTPPTYSLTRDGGIPVSSGAFSSDWTNISSDMWRYNTQLANGSYAVAMPEYISNNVRHCHMVPGAVVAGNVTPGDCGINLRVRAALDGALPSGTLMTDGLRNANMIPTMQPYSALGYTFVGSPTNVSIAPSLLTVTGDDAIVDWVVVELRSTLTTVVHSKPALLQRDGDVIDTDGNTYLNFPIAAGSYRLALRHRNHLGVMTNSAWGFTVDPSANLVDFRISGTSTYGTNARVLKGSVWCLWAGDATGNGTIAYTGSGNDRDPILVAIGGTNQTSTLSNVYDRRDVNLDGVIKYTGANNDRDPILVNIGGTVPTNTRSQQLP